MIAIDTNVAIRLLTKDDPKQHKKSLAIFKENIVFISLTVLQETEWVLRFSYEFSSSEIFNAITSLAGLANVEIESPNILSTTLELYSNGLDFSDALHLAQCDHCEKLFTFDKKFINKAKGNKICSVEKP